MGNGADSEIKIRFTTEHDGAGADAANAKLEETKRKAGGAADGFEGASKSVHGFRGAMRLASSAMGAFGFLGIISKIAELVKAFEDARVKKEAMLASTGAGNAEASIAGLKAGYDQLTESIKSAAAATDAVRANTDKLTEANRRLEDANLAIGEEREVAAIDKKDPLREEKEGAVRAKYGQRRADASGDKGMEDAATEEARLKDDIAARDRHRRDREQAAADAEKEAKDYSEKANAEKFKAIEFAQSPNIFGMAGRTFDGRQNPRIDEHSGYAAAYDKQAAAAFAAAAAARKDAEADRAATEADRGRLAAMPRVREAAAAESSAGKAKAYTGAVKADNAVAAAAEQRHRDERDLAQARRDKAWADREQVKLEVGLDKAKSSDDKENREAWEAKAALEAHERNRPAGGGGQKWSKEDTSLRTKWEKEQTEASGADRALEALADATSKLMHKLAATANASAARIKALDAKLSKDPYGDKGASE